MITSWKLDIKKELEQCLTLCRTQGILMTSQKCQHILLFCLRCLLQYYRMQSFLEGWTSFKFSEVDGQVKQTAPAQTLCTPIAKGQNFLLSWDVFSSKNNNNQKKHCTYKCFLFETIEANTVDLHCNAAAIFHSLEINCLCRKAVDDTGYHYGKPCL